MTACSRSGIAASASISRAAVRMAKANIGKRIVAYLIDSLIGGGVSLVLLVVIMGLFWVAMMVGAVAQSPIILFGSMIVMIPGLIIILAPMVLYFLLKDGLFAGRSIGKKLMGLKVMNITANRPCSKVDSIKRNIIMFVPIIGWIDLIMAIIDGEGRRFGDKFAGTQVTE
jgi:uncharacterized RDD family membrane protein YckC